MKPILPLLAAAAVIAATVSVWSPAAHAQQPTAEAAKVPIGSRCVVTLNWQIDLGARSSNEQLKSSGINTEGSIEGILLQVEADWVVLKDGSYENWIPRDKVLLMRASR